MSAITLKRNKSLSVIVEGVRFTLSSNPNPDGLREVVVTIGEYADKDVMVIAAFDEGGLTLVGDYVHLADDGDEVYVR